MPASENYTPNKHRMKGKGFVVFNKCPYCEGYIPTGRKKAKAVNL